MVRVSANVLVRACPFLMQTILVAISSVVIILVVWLVAVDYYRGRHPLFSNRNLFLFGLAFFQCLSAITNVVYGMRWQGVQITSGTYVRFVIGLVAFVPLFLLIYKWRRPVDWLARHIPTRSPSRTMVPILFVLGLSLMIGLESRFAILPLPGPLRTLALPVGRGFCCFSIVLLLWVWNEQRFNVVAWSVCPALILIVLLSLLRGEFGRRAVLSGVLAVAWGMYYFRWQFKTAVMNTPKYAAWALVMLLLIGGVTAIRSQKAETFSLSYRVRAVADAISLQQVKELFYTDTFASSAYAIQRFTTDLSPQPFHSTLYVLAHPIPREIWLGKPDSLAEILSNVVSVAELKRFNWGPGLIGHAWHEGGFIFIVYFAIVFGLLYGAFDERLMQQATNPYFVAITGAALGQVIAMARGDIGFFMVNWIYGVSGPMALVWLAGLFSQDRADIAADQDAWEAAQYWNEIDEVALEEAQPVWS